MKRFVLLLSAAMLVGANGPQASDPSSNRLPVFAGNLAQQADLAGASAWRVIPQDQAWRTLATARPADRQQARFEEDQIMLPTRVCRLEKASILQPGQSDERIAVTEAGPIIVARKTNHRSLVIGFHPMRSSMRYELAAPRCQIGGAY